MKRREGEERRWKGRKGEHGHEENVERMERSILRDLKSKGGEMKFRVERR